MLHHDSHSCDRSPALRIHISGFGTTDSLGTTMKEIAVPKCLHSLLKFSIGRDRIDKTEVFLVKFLTPIKFSIVSGEQHVILTSSQMIYHGLKKIKLFGQNKRQISVHTGVWPD